MKRITSVILILCIIISSAFFVPQLAFAEESFNGVYYIQNLYSNLYVRVENDSISNATPVEQYAKNNTSPTLTNIGKLSQLWMIKPITTGVYSIRPMHKLDMALTYGNSGTLANITPASTNDSQLLDTQKWSIKSDSAGGFSIQPYSNLLNNGNGSIEINSTVNDEQISTMARPVDNDVELSLLYTNTSNGTNISCKSIDSSTVSSWRFIAHNINPGIVIHNSRTQFDKDDVFTMVVSSYSMTNISQQFTWSSSNTYVATVSNGVITAKLPGTSSISFTSATGVTGQISISVNRAVLNARSEVDISPYLLEGYGLKTVSMITSLDVTVENVTATGQYTISDIDGTFLAYIVDHAFNPVDYSLNITFIKHNGVNLPIINNTDPYWVDPAWKFRAKTVNLTQNLIAYSGDVFRLEADVLLYDALPPFHTSSIELELP